MAGDRRESARPPPRRLTSPDWWSAPSPRAAGAAVRARSISRCPSTRGCQSSRPPIADAPRAGTPPATIRSDIGLQPRRPPSSPGRTAARYSGRRGADRRPAVAALAEALGAAMVTTIAGKGRPDRRPSAPSGGVLTTAVGRRPVDDADVVLPRARSWPPRTPGRGRCALPAAVRLDVDRRRPSFASADAI